jgi:hypothetical protein
MKTSVRRQCLRQCLGANKNINTFRWIGGVTGRVTAKVVLRNQGFLYEKAEKGVEKSCTGTVRRKRGLRKGKARSRGGKPRCIVARPTHESKEPSRRVNVHNERLFAIMRRAQEKLLKKADSSLRPTVSYGFKPGTYRGMRPFDESVERHLVSIWRPVAAGFPQAYRSTFFGANARQFIAMVRSLNEELYAPPPLPPRRGRPPSPPPRPVAPVTNSTIKTHIEKDQYGPNPCSWCRAEWLADGEFGACLSIQECVRNPDNIKKWKESSVPRTKRNGRKTSTRR